MRWHGARCSTRRRREGTRRDAVRQADIRSKIHLLLPPAGTCEPQMLSHDKRQSS
jgi:hypothetical protein